MIRVHIQWNLRWYGRAARRSITCFHWDTCGIDDGCRPINGGYTLKIGRLGIIWHGQDKKDPPL